MSEQQQIVGAYEAHMQKFEIYLRDTTERLTNEAWRQALEKVSHNYVMEKHLRQKYEQIFKAVGVNPREHPLWVARENHD